MDGSKLNNFSRQIYTQLCAWKPQLIAQAEEEPASNDDFCLKIRSPIKEEPIWLRIWTDADPGQEGPDATGEVTWEYDRFHSHSFGRPAKEAFDWLKDELDALFEGRKFVGSSMDGEKWAGSTELSKSELDELLAGKFDHKQRTERAIGGIMGLRNIPDSQKNLVIERLRKAPPINRVVGWESILVSPCQHHDPH